MTQRLKLKQESKTEEESIKIQKLILKVYYKEVDLKKKILEKCFKDLRKDTRMIKLFQLTLMKWFKDLNTKMNIQLQIK